MCGGLIHPIASRCKHCRAAIGDAVRQRSGAASLRALPALVATPTSLGLPSSTAAVALPLASSPNVNFNDSANAFEFAEANERPWWKRWPMIVVAVATVAIIVAVVLMVWPQDQRRGSKVVAPPAPSNMDTNPMPETLPALPSAPSNPADPWSGTGPAVPAPIDPSAPAPIDPSDPSAPTPIDPAAPGNPARDRFVSQLATSVCKQIADCTNIDPAMTGVLCDATVALLNQASPWSTCSFNAGKAATCLKRVQTLSCDNQLNTVDAVMLLNDLPACLEALRC